MKNLILISLLSLALAACSSETITSDKVSEEVIHKLFEASFDENTNKTTLVSQFRVGGPTGTTVALRESSKVTMNNQVPKEKNNILYFGTHYVSEFQNFLDLATFKYSTEKSTQQVSFRILSLKTPVISKVDLYNNIVINIKDETLDFSKDKLSISIKHNGVIKFINMPSKSFVLSEEELKTFGSGKIKISITRYHTEESSNQTLQSIYRTLDQEIEL